MPTVSRQNRLERVVPALLGLTVLAFACGSSSVAGVTRIAHGARWGVLLALFLVAAAWAGWTGLRRLPPSALAGAAVLVFLSVLSALWSVAPRLSFERALSLGLLLATGLLLAAAAWERPGTAQALLRGLVAGAAAVALAGLVVLLVAHRDGVVRASIEAPVRFRGLGENPNTAALLFALGVPLGLGLALAARSRGGRLLGAGVVLLLLGSIVASGSRGGLLAAGAGALAPALAAVRGTRSRALAGAAVLAALALCLFVQQLPQPTKIRPAAPQSQATTKAPQPQPKPAYVDADGAYPLDADIGKPLPGGGEPNVVRSFGSSSGRLQAWRGALQQVGQRPLLGYGFGTEGKVFVDRYYTFVAGLPESSYIGIALQLGAVGLLVLLGLVALLLLPARIAFGGAQRLLVGACVGSVIAGLVQGFFQSYIYSVGNIAAASFWISAFLIPGLSLKASNA